MLRPRSLDSMMNRLIYRLRLRSLYVASQPFIKSQSFTPKVASYSSYNLATGCFLNNDWLGRIGFIMHPWPVAKYLNPHDIWTPAPNQYFRTPPEIVYSPYKTCSYLLCVSLPGVL